MFSSFNTVSQSSNRHSTREPSVSPPDRIICNRFICKQISKPDSIVYADNVNNASTYSFIGFSFAQPDEPVILQLHTAMHTPVLSYDYIINPQPSCDNFADNVFANNVNR